MTSGDRELLTRALEVSELDAESAMIPRQDIVGVPADATLDELERVAAGSGRSRLVVYDGDLDRIQGILHVKDLLSVTGPRDSVSAGALARPPLMTPESRKVEDLMLDMRRTRQHIAVVVNEFGTVTGLVTLEDLLEELVGEIDDESDRVSRGIRQQAGGAWLVPGSLRPDELRAATGIVLPEGDWETVAGYLIASLDRLPKTGDRVSAGGRTMVVTRVEDHRVVEVRILGRARVSHGAG